MSQSTSSLDPTLTQPSSLLISYSGGAGRHLYVGGLFRVVGRVGHAFRVELVYVHPQHPMADVPVEKWVAGLRSGPGGFYLDPQMVREWIKSPCEYDTIVASHLQTHNLKKLLPRVASLAEQRFKSEYRRLRGAMRPLVPVQVPENFGLPGTRWTLIAHPLRYFLDRPVPGPKSREAIQPSSAQMLIEALEALAEPVGRVRIESLEGHCTLEGVTDHFDPAVFFHIRESKKGIFILKKSMRGTCVNPAKLDKFRPRAQVKPETARACVDAHFEYLQRLREISDDIRKSGRLIAENRAMLDALRLLPR